MTPNGKIDVRRLPAPEEMAAAPRTYVPPRNDHEQALAEIWQEVLTLRQIGIDDDFFELGADSLSATRAFARINRRFDASLPLRAIFENPPWPRWPPRWTMPRSAPPPGRSWAAVRRVLSNLRGDPGGVMVSRGLGFHLLVCRNARFYRDLVQD